MLEKLQLWLPLDEQDQEAVCALPHTLRTLRAHEYIVREGDRPTHCCLLLSGYAIRHKIAGSGDRQIFSVHMKGDVVDLHNSILRRSDHNIQALTTAEVAMIPNGAIKQIAAELPMVGQAMWYETLVDAAIFREWTLNVGRRDARARTAHLLCEFSVRLTVAGLGTDRDFILPMTQEQLADALALTSIHINRTLKGLEQDGLIERTKREIRIIDFEQLSRIGDFNAGYLHLDRIPRSVQ
ncbi:Crp/Fnr family transcriptional regulator [Sphingomonas sp. KR3-1]|uniref:Crp/Fnr family transcriptional regulator n=1 Tax=Sphingomonas sp. KR3-1 TaxID=3156611 RepID=UPI0032B437C8